MAAPPSRGSPVPAALALAGALACACAEPQAPGPVVPEPTKGLVVCPPGADLEGDRCVQTEVRTVVSCPPGTHFESGACLANLSTECPDGMRFQEGTGCLPVVLQPIDPPPNAGFPPGLTSGSKKCPAGMAHVPGGAFTLAGYRASAGTSVTVASFCLDLTEVTVGEYKACSTKGACPTASLTCNPTSSSWTAGDDQLPLNCIDYKDASRYCASLARRLPTEDEWEWAARAGDEARKFPWGTKDDWTRVCASSPNPRTLPCRVGSFTVGDTPLGIHDMAGSLWEWTTTTRPEDATRPGDHAIRGGSWDIVSKFSIFAAGSRVPYEPDYRSKAVGFRCARSAAP